jgi:hypothetical protein
MRWVGGFAGAVAGASALAALLALAPPSAPSAPAPVRAQRDPSLAEAVARLADEVPPLPREYAPVAIQVPFQPIPEPGTGALAALGLALLSRLARPLRACHPAR